MKKRICPNCGAKESQILRFSIRKGYVLEFFIKCLRCKTEYPEEEVTLCMECPNCEKKVDQMFICSVNIDGHKESRWRCTECNEMYTIVEQRKGNGRPEPSQTES